MSSSDSVVLENRIYDNTTGILIEAGRALDNQVSANEYGIVSDSGQIEGNQVFHNSQAGILIRADAVVSENDVFENREGILIGRDFAPFVSGAVLNNHVFDNQQAGIVTHHDGQVAGNLVYGNLVGVRAMLEWSNEPSEEALWRRWLGRQRDG